MVPTSQAMEMAREANLDLVEVAANERPPVCKILDYGKFRYQQSRKKTKTKVHQQKLKEIRVRPKTGDHDVDTKINQARKFLEHKDKVLVNVLFRGRELQHIEEGPAHHRLDPGEAGGRGQGREGAVDGRQAHDGHARSQGGENVSAAIFFPCTPPASLYNTFLTNGTRDVLAFGTCRSASGILCISETG